MDVLVEENDECLAWLDSVDHLLQKDKHCSRKLKLLQVLPLTGAKYDDYG